MLRNLLLRNTSNERKNEKEFTHRLGHSIGIKAHESPYLNKGNFGTRLRPGMVFTAEPGVYVLNNFGIRHEDILVVK